MNMTATEFNRIEDYVERKAESEFRSLRNGRPVERPVMDRPRLENIIHAAYREGFKRGQKGDAK